MEIIIKKMMVVTSKRTLEDELKLEKDKIRDDENSLIEKIGIRLLMKEISKSKKPIVAHNCLLDFFYILTQCFEDLPENYNDFKKLIHRIFPNIIDTKFIAHSDHLKEFFSSTVLNQVLERLQKPPFKEIELEWENPYNTYSLKSPKEHEAGYDSFLTGYCFLALLDHLNVPLELNFEKSKALAPFLNRIALQRIALPYIHITGDEPKLNRTHVFHIKFPQTWQVSDIQDHFKIMDQYKFHG
ncbi:hypothetical protein PVAND_006420 [Polypedilum vanderplanki]|uniref:Poly(A)-specific ribonuclease RNA-binding domain-containing protein n=1 Tax=Polypedilum vanderplanki TaxID=319348 RepID=A0A9J6C3W6_POLVA|nr:hypothetical protein PVAND_006420 [Polypedilum vanderplanki]